MPRSKTEAEKVAEKLRGREPAPRGGDIRGVCLENKGRLEYSNRDYTYVGPDHPEFEATGGTGILFRFVDGSPFAHVEGDPIRYKFRDGSAIVQLGDTWAVEGEAPFVMRVDE